MKGSLAKARVLYAPVEEIGNEGRLLRACRIHTIIVFIELVLSFSKPVVINLTWCIFYMIILLESFEFPEHF